MPQTPINTFTLAIGLWLESSGCSRQDYTHLREVLALQHTLSRVDTPLNLPLKLDTLKRYVRSHLPMLRLLRKAMPVVFKKQTSLPEQQKIVRIKRLF